MRRGYPVVVVVVSQLHPTATRTLLLARVVGWVRCGGDRFGVIGGRLAAVDRVIAGVVAAHGGVRFIHGGVDGCFVAAFDDAGAAVACALELQAASFGGVRLRMGVHSWRPPVRDEGAVIGAAIGCAARLGELAQGGQILLCDSTKESVTDRLPDRAWLVEWGVHRLDEQGGLQRVSRLCHPDLGNDCASLRAADCLGGHYLPVQLTSFVGRQAAISELRGILLGNQVLTLVGVGGVGKTRLAIEVAAEAAGQFGAGVRFVDLAGISDPAGVSLAMARALKLPDRPGRSTMQTLTGFFADRQMLVVMDNCEHLLDACAQLIVALCGACRQLTILATSREPLAVPGEVIWQVPSLAPEEAMALFCDRARRARPGFTLTEDTAAAMRETCLRLDGLPLAIELAAARVRTLSLPEILDSLDDRFRTLTGGARTALPRQQTLRACVDWSHALLSDQEKALLRRLSVFIGGFDSTAAQAVTCDGNDGADVLDRLGALVDKSLVIANVSGNRTRYRLLETVRLYAQDKLAASGEADTVRVRHREHYLAVAMKFDNGPHCGDEQPISLIETEIDNLRAVFSWSCARRDSDAALQLASSLQPLWLTRGRIREGLAWLDTALTQTTTGSVAPTALQARAMVDKATLVGWIGGPDSLELAQTSLNLARDIDDPALLARALTACITAAAFNPDVIQPYFAEAVTLARVLGDDWRLSQILGAWALAAYATGDPTAARAVAEEGRELADAIGDGFISRRCRWCLAWTQFAMGDPGAAAEQFRQAAAEAEHAQDTLSRAVHLVSLAIALAHHGDAPGASAAADAAVAAGAKFGGEIQGLSYAALALASLAAGDLDLAHEASERAWHRLTAGGGTGRAAVRFYLRAELALIHGDLVAARRWADEAVSATNGLHAMKALTTRARVAIEQGRRQEAECFAREALTCAAAVKAYVGVPDIIECLAQLAVPAGKNREAARLFGATQHLREHMGLVRFSIYDAGIEASIAELRKTLTNTDFDGAWAEGAALSVDEVVAYVQRGRGERKRPSSGWASLTPAERDVVRLVSEGLTNKDIATKLFVSPRTVQTHLTHVYTKLGLTSRVQLVQEAACHASQ